MIATTEKIEYGKEVIGTFNPTTDTTSITITFPPKV